MSVRGNTFTTETIVSGTGINPLPSIQSAEILLSTLSVTEVVEFVKSSKCEQMLSFAKAKDYDELKRILTK